jgi:hypothetical protein
MTFHPSDSSLNSGEIEVVLDGLPVERPANRRSLVAIRSYLETLAMERQRILFSFSVDGRPASLAQPLATPERFSRVEAESMDLEEMPLQLLKTAYQQTLDAREKVESAVALVLINNGDVAREFWWDLARELKEPLLTMTLLPDNLGGPANGSATPAKLRKWQLQQLAAIIKTVDDACWTDDPLALSNALESRALPWLDGLAEFISLWQETVAAGSRLAAGRRE